MDNCIFHRFRRLLWALFNPIYWIQNDPTNKKLDKFVNELLDMNPGVTERGNHHHRVGGLSFWTANYPYAYGTYDGYNGLPRRTTRIRLKEFIEEKMNDQ